VRAHGAAAMFKLYILNRTEAFFGFYPIAEHTVSLHGRAGLCHAGEALTVLA